MASTTEAATILWLTAAQWTVILAIIQGLSGILLAALTWFYLIEVRKTRQISEKIMRLEWSPSIVAEITSQYQINKTTGSLDISCNLTVSNTGKQPATSLKGRIELQFASGGNTQELAEIPELAQSYNKPFVFSLPATAADLAAVELLLQDPTAAVRTSFPVVPATVTLSYKDIDDSLQTKCFRFEYRFSQWIKI